MEIKKLKIIDIKPSKFNPSLDLKPEDEEYKKIKNYKCIKKLLNKAEVDVYCERYIIII